VVLVLPKPLVFSCMPIPLNKMSNYLKELTSLLLLLLTNIRTLLKLNVISKLVKISHLQATKTWHSSSMILTCLKWINGVIKKHWKLYVKVSIMVVSILWINHQEETLKTLKIYHLLELWIILEAAEMMSQTDLNVKCLSSIWFSLFLLKSFSVLLSNIFLNQLNILNNSIRLLNKFLLLPLNYGIESKILYSLHLLNSIIFSIWENFQEFSKDYFKLIKKQSNQVLTVSNQKSSLLLFGNMNLREFSLIN
jgi:hypothetical protein